MAQKHNEEFNERVMTTAPYNGSRSNTRTLNVNDQAITLSGKPDFSLWWSAVDICSVSSH